MNAKETFITKSNIKYNNKFDYSLVTYVNSHTRVQIICPVHGIFEQRPTTHLSSKCGCPKCADISREQTNIEKYGVKRHTNRKKANQTMLEKYGVEQYNNKEKARHTLMDKYGFDNPMKVKRFRINQQQTCLDKYGSNYYIERLEQVKQTNLKKYGVEFPLQNEDIHNKTKQTNLENCSGVYYSQQHMINILPLIEDYDWLFDQYINQNKTATQIADELDISDSTIGRYLYKHEIAIKQSYNQSFKAIQWLESIIEQENINIQHALNGGEYQIPGTRYRADGYCQETNTIYEFHGDCFHGNPKLFESDEKCHPFDSEITAGELYQKTIEREQELRDLGYNLIIMWEKDYGSKNIIIN